MTITRTRPSHLSWPLCFASTLCSKMFWLMSPRLLTSSTWIIGTFFPWESALLYSWLWLVGNWHLKAWVPRSRSGQNLVFLWLLQSLSRVIGSKPCGFMMNFKLINHYHHYLSSRSSGFQFILNFSAIFKTPSLYVHKCFNPNKSSIHDETNLTFF